MHPGTYGGSWRHVTALGNLLYIPNPFFVSSFRVPCCGRHSLLLSLLTSNLYKSIFFERSYISVIPLALLPRCITYYLRSLAGWQPSCTIYPSSWSPETPIMTSINYAILLILLAFSLHFQDISSTSDPDDLTFISKWAAIKSPPTSPAGVSPIGDSALRASIFWS